MKRKKQKNTFINSVISMIVILFITLLFFAAGYFAADALTGIGAGHVDLISCASFAGLTGFFCSVIFLLRR